jgi:hypothetical protein
VEYDEFDAEYNRVVEAVKAGLSTVALVAEIERLRALADGIDDESGRKDAGYDLAVLEDLLAHDDAEQPSEVTKQARAAYAEATRYDGTAAERIARAEAGIEKLGRIAAGADPEEREAITGLNESLDMLIGALRPDVR